jgi:predicted MFS family arabinose efflux permease
VVGTFSSFFDLSQAVGAFVCGAVVAATGDRGAFGTGAVLAVVALILLRSGIDPRTRQKTTAHPLGAGAVATDPGCSAGA